MRTWDPLKGSTKTTANQTLVQINKPFQNKCFFCCFFVFQRNRDKTQKVKPRRVGPNGDQVSPVYKVPLSCLCLNILKKHERKKPVSLKSIRGSKIQCFKISQLEKDKRLKRARLTFRHHVPSSEDRTRMKKEAHIYREGRGRRQKEDSLLDKCLGVGRSHQKTLN